MAGAAVISGQCLASQTDCLAPDDKYAGPIEHYLGLHATKAGTGFFVVYNSHTRNPLYAVEKLSRGALSDGNEKGRRPAFFSEPQLPAPFQTKAKDFADSKFDRGHMVAAADFAEQDCYGATFSLGNISPQAPGLNKGLWAKLEAWIRSFLLQHIVDEAIVITGPVFAPIFINHSWIHLQRTVGSFPRLIAVPTHFFKVLVGKKGDNTVVAAFMVPNVDGVPRNGSVSSYLVRLDQLEAVLGYSLLPRLEGTREMLDAHVPPERDLVQLLNAQLSLQTDEGAALQLDDVGKSSNLLMLPAPSKQLVATSDNRKNITNVLHLCECIDCNRPMFPTASNKKR